MPHVKMQKLGKQSGWGLWFITETEEELSFIACESCPDEIVNPMKRFEWLAGRAMVRTLVELNGLTYYGMRKDEFGKPFLKEHAHQISLSHSYPYVAGQIDPEASVGIDVEQPKEKLLRIATKVMSADEVLDAGESVVKHCVYWCAKEALFKVNGKRGLLFADHLKLAPFQLEQNGALKGIIHSNGLVHEVSLAYSIQPEYVLVYTQPDQK